MPRADGPRFGRPPPTKSPAECDIPHAACAFLTLAVRLDKGVSARPRGPTLGMAPGLLRFFRMKRIVAAVIGVIALTGVAHAAGPAPVAVVEDVQGKVTGAELMDYVVPGQVIKLGAGAKVTIGYMKSCWHETISGIGTVIVGTGESSVHLAEFKAGKVPCDSSQAERINKEAGESAATLVRSLRDDTQKASPPLVLHGQSPIVETSERGRLLVERLDVKGEHYEVDLTKA